jgi:uncharacterized protein YjaZ
MGIVQTDVWLEADFENPAKICKRLLPVFKGLDTTQVYDQLVRFGMYKPNRGTKQIFEKLKKNEVWSKVELLFQQYKEKWNGPDIPIYIFPIGQQSGLFSRRDDKTRGGVSFPDKMFLFLSNHVNLKELEALFVHEYHHVCRLNKQNKKFEDYTLLDSIIIEGLAEYSVMKHCGRQFLAEWCSMYSEAEMKKLWEKYLKNKMEKKKNERGHDELLFGGGRIPSLLGYAVGFKIVEDYFSNNHYTAKLSFFIPANKFLTAENIFFQEPKS